MSSKPETMSPLARLLRKKKESEPPPLYDARDYTPDFTKTGASEETVAREESVVTGTPQETVSQGYSELAPKETVALEETVALRGTVVPRETVAKGYSQLSNNLLDDVLPGLDPYEQAVLTQLCRLAWGYQSTTCSVGFKRLMKRTNMGKRKLGESVSKLEFLGHVRRLSVEQGGSVYDRGTTYEIMLPPPPTVARRATVASGETGARRETVALGETNKDKDLKEIIKGAVRARSENCPDCNGTSWFYPKGADGGVKRCTHPKVNKTGK